MTLRLTPAAEADLAEIADVIAADNPAAAQRWLDAMQARCARIAAMPGIGTARSDVAPGLRMLAAGAYLVLYRRIEGGAEIVRVVHGARRWRALFGAPPEDETEA
jgi:toxin ParE1/3/4